MKWIKIKSLNDLPQGLVEIFFIRYDGGTQKESGTVIHLRDLYENGWEDIEYLDESSPSDNTQIRGGWVRVQDGLPPLIDDKDYSENVIAFCNGILMVMCYMYINEDGGGYVWANCYGDIKGDAEFDDDYYPTHWMPLPTPPND